MSTLVFTLIILAVIFCLGMLLYGLFEIIRYYYENKRIESQLKNDKNEKSKDQLRL